MRSRAPVLVIAVIVLVAAAFMVGRLSVTKCGIAPDAGALLSAPAALIR